MATVLVPGGTLALGPLSYASALTWPSIDFGDFYISMAHPYTSTTGPYVFMHLLDDLLGRSDRGSVNPSLVYPTIQQIMYAEGRTWRLPFNQSDANSIWGYDTDPPNNSYFVEALDWGGSLHWVEWVVDDGSSPYNNTGFSTLSALSVDASETELTIDLDPQGESGFLRFNLLQEFADSGAPTVAFKTPSISSSRCLLNGVPDTWNLNFDSDNYVTQYFYYPGAARIGLYMDNKTTGSLTVTDDNTGQGYAISNGGYQWWSLRFSRPSKPTSSLTDSDDGTWHLLDLGYSFDASAMTVGDVLDYGPNNGTDISGNIITSKVLKKNSATTFTIYSSEEPGTLPNGGVMYGGTAETAISGEDVYGYYTFADPPYRTFTP